MKIRLIHLGVGGRGKWPISRAAEREDFESVALVDVNEENLAAAREVSGLPESACFRDMKEAVDKVYADAIVVITPTQLHAQQCMEALRSGKHVMVEKPFTLDLSEARQIVKEADSRDLRVAVCQNDRYSASSVTIRRLVREGTYGKTSFGLLTKYGMRRGTHHSGKVRHSYLWERGIHDFDTMRSLFDARPTHVWGHSFNPQWSPYDHGAGTYAWVGFEGGATCGALCTFSAHKPGTNFRIEFEGGTLESDGRELRLQRPGTKIDERLPLDEVPPGETVLLDGFYRYIAEGVEPDFGGHQNLITVALVEAVGVSSDEKRVVDFQTFFQH